MPYKNIKPYFICVSPAIIVALAAAVAVIVVVVAVAAVEAVNRVFTALLVWWLGEETRNGLAKFDNSHCAVLGDNA